jgi:hypothetical protein
MTYYYKLNFQNSSENMPDNGGVYKIIATDGYGNPKSINRVCGIDKDGILYIGESNSIQKRMGDFTKSAVRNYKSTNHSGGVLYSQSDLLCEQYPYNDFYVMYEVCDNHTNKEKELLKDYFLMFGEYPPLNNSNG